MSSELESDLQDTVGWYKKGLVDFNTVKTHLVLFNWSNNAGAIDVKLDGPVLEEKSSFKVLGLTFSTKMDWGSHLNSIAKTASKKIGALILSVKFFLLRFFCISVNLPYGYAWNTVVMPGLVLLVPKKFDTQDSWSFTCCLF